MKIVAVFKPPGVFSIVPMSKAPTTNSACGAAGAGETQGPVFASPDASSKTAVSLARHVRTHAPGLPCSDVICRYSAGPLPAPPSIGALSCIPRPSRHQHQRRLPGPFFSSFGRRRLSFAIPTASFFFLRTHTELEVCDRTALAAATAVTRTLLRLVNVIAIPPNPLLFTPVDHGHYGFHQTSGALPTQQPLDLRQDCERR
jgi:hypothetical protein